MACRNYETTLDSLIDLAIRLDNLLQDRKPKARPLINPTSSKPKPMELWASQITATERMHRRWDGLCFYCGKEITRSLTSLLE